MDESGEEHGAPQNQLIIILNNARLIRETGLESPGHGAMATEKRCLPGETIGIFARGLLNLFECEWTKCNK